MHNWNALRHTLSMQDGCLYYGHRIVVPKSLLGAVLKQLRDGHLGMTRMKMLARGYVYWTNIDRDIEENVQKCRHCQETAKMPRKTILSSLSDETKPWNRVHIDFAGPINGKMYLVVVDSYSKWPEVLDMSSSTVKATLRELKKLFARFENPRVIVSYNGTQFTSKEFQEFCEKQGIEHIRSFHPQSNGQAERFVDTLKRTLLKRREERSQNPRVFKMLSKELCTINSERLSSEELFLGRQLRTTLTLLKEEIRNEKGSRKTRMERQCNLHHGARERSYQIEDPIYIRN
uniref:RNA-directed DNA polymerase n=1 Tax=Haemonchus placei TaxID=6290 RepID=A0A0N4WFH5_HAEPC